MLESCTVSFSVCYKFIDNNSLFLLKHKFFYHVRNAILVVA